MARATEDDGGDREVGQLLRRAHRRYAALFAARFAEHELTPLQFAVLTRLRAHGPLSQNRLGRETAMDPNTVQGVVLRLLHRGLLCRSGSAADKRQKVLTLSAEGEALAARLADEGRAVSEATLGRLTAAQRRVFLDLLARLG